MALQKIEVEPVYPPPAYTLVDTYHTENPPSVHIDYSDKTHLHEQSHFVQRKIPWEYTNTRYHDTLFMFVLGGIFCVFVTVSNDCLSYLYELNKGSLNLLLFKYAIDNDIKNNYHSIGLFFGISLSICLILGILQLIGLVFFYRIFITCIFVLSTFTFITLAVYFYYQFQYVLCGATLAIMMGFYLLITILYNKVAFSVEIVKIGSRIIRSNITIWLIYLAMFVINSIGMLLYSIIVYAAYLKWKEEPDLSIRYGMWMIVIFCGYYFNEVFTNSFHVIIGSICAKWYYESNVKDITVIHNTFLKCFGSICFGSLFASIISLLKDIILFNKPNDKFMKYPFVKLLWRLFEMLVLLINYTVQYFNEYAFAYMSIHSKNYMKSSYKMYKMYNTKGLSTLVSESIIKLVLKIYTVFVSVLTSTVAYCIIQQLKQPPHSLIIGDSLQWYIIVASGIFAMQICRMITTMINAFVHVFFVCLIENQDILQWTHPREYLAIAKYLPFSRHRHNTIK